MPNSSTNWSAFFSNWISGTFPGREEAASSLDLQALEDRVLYSAGPVPVDVLQPEVVEVGLDAVDLADSMEAQFDFVGDAIDSYDFVGLDDAFSVQDSLGNQEVPNELVIVDTSVEGYQQLVDDILSSKTSDRNVEIAFIDGNSNGIRQVTNAIAQRNDITAIHLVTHGDDGQLSIGNSVLNQDSLAELAGEIATWKDSLTDDADFLIYGCNVAESETGEAFVNELSALLDADILASNDVTGHESLQGDWFFEYQVGHIDSQIVFSVDARANWNHSLEVVDASSADGSAGSVAASDNGQVIRAFTSDVRAGSVLDDVYYVQSSIADGTVTGEVRINDTNVAGNQDEVSVATTANGNTIFVWTSDHGAQDGVYGRLIDANGNDIRSEFQVDLGGAASNASVDMDDAGNFVVTWQSSFGGNSDVFVAYFDTTGNLVNSTIVNNDTAGFQGNADVALNNNGELVVAWDEFTGDTSIEGSTFIQKFQYNPTTNNLDAVGNEIENFVFGQVFYSPDVDISARGDFVIASTSEAIDGFKFLAPGAETGIEARSFYADTSLAATFISINSTNNGVQHSPAVAILEDDNANPDDNIVVFAWEGVSEIHADDQGVYFRGLSFDGSASTGNERLVSPNAVDGIQEHVALSTYDNNKSFVIGYEGFNSGGDGYHLARSGPDLPPQDPTDLSTGIQINTNGGNDAYWYAEDTAFLNGLGEFSIELTFSSDQSTDTVPLFSYQTDTSPNGGVFHDDVLIQYNGDGTLSVYLPGGNGASDILNLSGIDYSTIFDGQQHTLAFGFENGSNEWSVFVDGVETDSGTTSTFSGATLTGGGALVLGQEQDSPQGDFDNNVYFSGTIHDLRIWDIKLDGAHPQTNLDIQVDSSNIPAGLIANWQFNELTGAGNNTVEDVVDTSNELFRGSTGAPGAIAGNADMILTIAEGSPTGTHVATVDATSPNHQEAFTYQLTNDAGGRFQIDPDTGAISVANGSLLDFATASSHTVTVEVTDSENATYSEDFEIIVQDVNEAPELLFNFPPIFNIGVANNLIASTTLHYLDPDVIHDPTDVVYQLTSLPTDGILSVNGTALDLAANSTFTQQQINDNLLRYSHTGTTAVVDGFSFEVTDGIASTSGDFEIFVGNSIDEGGTGTFGTDVLIPGGVDGDSYTLNSPVANGTISVNGTVLGIGQSFTKAQLDAGQVIYTHNGSETSFDNFELIVQKGTDPPTTQFVNLTIVPVNDAPDLDLDSDDSVHAGIDYSLAYTQADGVVPVVDTDATVTDVDSSRFNFLQIQLAGFVDGADEELLINGIVLTPGQPSNQLTTIGTTTIRLDFDGSLLTVTDSAGGTISHSELQQLVRSVEYQHTSAASTSGDRDLEFRISDESGAISPVAFSTITVQDTNDAPLVAVNAGITVNEGSAGNEITTAMLNEGDPDDNGAGLTYTIGPNGVTNGTLLLNNNPIGIGDTFTQADIDAGALSYTHNGSETTSDSFEFSLADGGEDGAGSVQSSFAITVTPVNDQVTITGTTNPTFIEGSSANAILPSMISHVDPDDGGVGLTYTVTGTPSAGTINLGGTALGIGGTFTHADLIAGAITYDHSGTETTTDGFTFTLADGGENGTIPVPGALNFTISPSNDAPVVGGSLVSTVDEGSMDNVIDQLLLDGVDPDDDGVGLTYTLTTGVSNGTLTVNGIPLGDLDTFTQADIDLGNLKYTHDGSETTGDAFSFTLADGGENGATPTADSIFTINVTPVNDQVQINVLSSLTVSEGATNVVIDDTYIQAFDDDDSGTDLTYTLTGPPANGTLFLSGNPLSMSDTFSVADVIAGNITYSHDGTSTTSDSLSLTVEDGGEDGTTAQAAILSISISSVDDAPIAHDNIFGVAHGESLTEDVASLLYNDTDPEGTPLLVTAIVTQPTNGTVTLNGDGTFTYTPDPGSTATIDSFVYQVTDGNSFDTATAEIHIDDCGFIATNEFQVNEDTADHPHSTAQTTVQNNRFTNSAVATAPNGDYVVVWTSIGQDGSADALMRFYDFSGTPLTGQIEINPGGDDVVTPSVAIGPDGSTVVTYLRGDRTNISSLDLYIQQFDASGNAVGSEFLVTEDINNSMADDFTVRQQVNPTVTFNENGDFAVVWNGASDRVNGGTVNGDIYLRRFLANGTIENIVVVNDASLEFELNADVALANNGDAYVLWDDDSGIHSRVVFADGTLGAELVTPSESYILDVRQGSIDYDETSGLVAVSYQIRVDDGVNPPNWEVHLQVLDPYNPQIVLNATGNQFSAGDQIEADVSFNQDGSIIMTWTGPSLTDPGDSDDIFGRKFRVEYENGVPYAEAIGDQFVISGQPSVQAGASVAALDSENFVVVWTGVDDNDTTGIFARQFGNQSSVQISGTVAEQNFVDDGNGNISLVQEGVFENAVVKLYRDDGDGVRDADDRLFRVVTTDASGNYVFDDLKDDTTYWVTVDSRTLASSGVYNSGYDFLDGWAEQTFGDGGVKIGGLQAGVSDDATSLLTSQHVSEITIGNTNATGVDFGFSFDVVTNTRAGSAEDDDGGFADTWHQSGQTGNNERSVQGSLRQFITNANAIDGENDMHFVPGVAATETVGGNSWWEIAVDAALPQITDENTIIDGRAYDIADGTTRLNSNSLVHSGNLGDDGIAGTGDETVGVGADGIAGTGDEQLLGGLDAPELEIHDILGVATGISVNAADVEISHVSIHGFGNTNNSASGNVFVDQAGDGFYLHDSIIGAEAGDYSNPATSAFSSTGVYVQGADGGRIENNLISFHARSGITLSGATADNIQNWTIIGNEISSNALEFDRKDGIDIVRGSNHLIQGNFISDNAGYAIDTFASDGGNLIRENTIVGNGTGNVENGGVRLFGDSNSVQNNVISGNNGSGVVVISDVIDRFGTFSASTGNLISQNSFSDNTGIAIDLVDASSNNIDAGDGISDNNDAPDAGAGNAGIDHPELSDAYIDSSGLHIIGVFPDGLVFEEVEVYVANSGDGDTNVLTDQQHGEGELYLGTIPLTAGFIYDGATGEFQLELATPPGGWPPELTNGGSVTVIGIQPDNNTSEFSNVSEINDIPDALPSEVTTLEDEPHEFKVADFLVADTNHTTFDHIIVDSLPGRGTLLFGGVPVDLSQVPLTVTAADLQAGMLTFEPVANENDTDNTAIAGYTRFGFRVNDSLQTSVNPSTMTINVTPVNDAPVATEDFYSTAEDTTLNVVANNGILSNDADADDALVVTKLTDPANGTLTLNPDGTFVYVPDPNFNGVDSFTYELQDPAGETSSVTTVEITVAATNDAPVATDDTYWVSEGGTAVHDLSINDFDIDMDFVKGQTTVTIVSGPTNGTAFIDANGDLNYQHDGTEVFTDSVTYQIVDQGGLTDTATVTINVTPTDDQAVVNDDDIGQVSIGNQLVVDPTVLLENDFDVDSTLSIDDIVIVTQPAQGTVEIVNGQLVFTPDATFTGDANFEYQIVVDGGVSERASVSVSVEPQPVIPNAEPVVNPPEPEEQEEEDDLIEFGGGLTNNDDEDDEIIVTNSRSNDNNYLVDGVYESIDGLENSDFDSLFKVEYAGATYVYSSRLDDLSLVNLTGTVIADAEKVSELENIYLAGLTWDELDSAKQSYLLNGLQIGVPTIVSSAASFLTVGYLAWIIRGGVLLTTFMSSVPAWSSFDILSVIDAAGGKDESIEQMVDQ